MDAFFPGIFYAVYYLRAENFSSHNNYVKNCPVK